MSVPSDYQVTERTPTAEEHQHLRRASGLRTQFPLAATIAALPSTWHGIVITHVPTSTTVGMGRIIGDGALFLQIVDVAVDPAHQRRGLGRLILGELLGKIQRDAASAYVSLIGDPPGQSMYRSFGFADTAPSLGMYLARKKQDGP